MAGDSSKKCLKNIIAKWRILGYIKRAEAVLRAPPQP